MEIQAIGARAFSVYIPEAELTMRHIRPDSITAVEARELVEGLIDRADTVSLELFPGRHEVLIFVRRSFGDPEIYAFADLEELLRAILALEGSAETSLFHYGGLWILAVWPGCEGHRAQLSEFASPLDAPPGYILHLREHGRIIADGDAASVLKNAFFTKASQ